MDSTGNVLDGAVPLIKARLQYEEPLRLTFHVRQVDVCCGSDAFAAILGDGSVVTWGAAGQGGDSSAVRDRLKNVQQIQATSWAFAAILRDGSVVNWGVAERGGDSSAVRNRLRNVWQIQATVAAFAAIGSVVTWGQAAYGGDSSAVRDRLRNVRQIKQIRVPLLRSPAMALS